MDVYRQLYELAGYEASDQAGRDKPPCCDTETGEPPVDDARDARLFHRGPRSPGRRRGS
jgi:hypothetical protein